MTRLLLLITFAFLTACASEAPPPEEDVLPVPAQAEAQKINEVIIGGQCSAPQYCGKYGKVDCNSAADGPLYYFLKDSGDIVSTCGGACMGPDPRQRKLCRTMCPPPDWSCDG